MSAARALVVAALLCSGCSGNAPQTEPTSASDAAPNALTPPPADFGSVESLLPPPIRASLRPRMQRHGADLNALNHHVVVGDYGGTAAIARRIAEEPMIARPVGAEDATILNNALPEAFFTHQERLRARATVLADAASGGERADVAQAFGRLGETCVACHESFATEPLVRP
jgi:hypothetical protein